MSIFDFTRKRDPDQDFEADESAASQLGHSYGITEAIQLLRSLPRDQSDELIVGVMGATLESLNVHLSDIIEDATRKQEVTQERIAAVNAQVADLETQVAQLRVEIAALEADLKETTDAKERLQRAERQTSGGRRFSVRDERSQTLLYGQPPPLPSDVGRPPG